MSLFRKTALLLVSLTLAGQALAQQLPVPPSLAAKSWLLLDISSNQVLNTEKPDDRIEPASLTKLMTAYLTFAAIHKKTLALEQPLPVSEKAWRTGGSKMFVRVDTQVAVEDLIKGMIVQSGNDACVTLAEGIAGSEETFAQLMNREAQRLGMKSSSFRNSTGLPDPQLYTSARDLALLASAIIRDFPEYYSLYSLKEYTYNGIKQPNRNRLLYMDPSVDGMKTGHTSSAGYCLVSTARRGERRLISMVLGAASNTVRAQESLKLLNFGFQAYDAVKLYAKNEAVSNLKVWKGTEKTVKAGFTEDFIMVVPKGYGPRIKSELQSQQPLIAPVAQGQVVGTMKVSLDDKPYGEFPVVAIDGVPVAGIFGRAIDTIRLWFN